MKRPHRKVVGTSVVEGKLFRKVIQGIEGAGGVEARDDPPLADPDKSPYNRGRNSCV